MCKFYIFLLPSLKEYWNFVEYNLFCIGIMSHSSNLTINYLSGVIFQSYTILCITQQISFASAHCILYVWHGNAPAWNAIQSNSAEQWRQIQFHLSSISSFAKHCLVAENEKRIKQIFRLKLHGFHKEWKFRERQLFYCEQKINKIRVYDDEVVLLVIYSTRRTTCCNSFHWWPFTFGDILTLRRDACMRGRHLILPCVCTQSCLVALIELIEGHTSMHCSYAAGSVL